MKIIDLLVKIANGEQVPKKIKYSSYIMTYDVDENDYRTLEKNYYDADVKTYKYLTDCIDLFADLNNYVEIIEEPKKIEKIPLPSFDEFKSMSAEERYVITAKEYDLLDELIDEINNLKEK